MCYLIEAALPFIQSLYYFSDFGVLVPQGVLLQYMYNLIKNTYIHIENQLQQRITGYDSVGASKKAQHYS